jgi:predicted dehydrogenase
MAEHQVTVDGQVRVAYAEANWGRIEDWHPDPRTLYAVGPHVDVGVYPLTLVTTMLGPARSVRAWGWELKRERQTVDGTPFRIGSPDLIVTADMSAATIGVWRHTPPQP